jgi:hypothetical protein
MLNISKKVERLVGNIYNYMELGISEGYGEIT